MKPKCKCGQPATYTATFTPPSGIYAGLREIERSPQTIHLCERHARKSATISLVTNIQLIKP